MVGDELEAAGQRDLVVAVVAGDDTELVANALMQAGVEPQLRLVGSAMEAVAGMTRVDEGTEEIEAGRYAKCLAGRTHELHTESEERSVEVADASFVQAAAQMIGIRTEAHSMRFENIAGAADGGAGAVAVLADSETCAGDDESSAGADVESVLLVAARAYDVQGRFGTEVDVLACFKQAVAQTQEFIYGCTAHLDGSEHSCNLDVSVLFAGDVEHELVGFFAAEGLARDEVGENVFHCSVVCCGC